MMRTKYKFLTNIIFSAVLGATGFAVASEQTKGEASFYSKVAGAVENSGFSMDGYWVWGSSVVKGDDGLYHMYASRWPKTYDFNPGWRISSEIVHATSKTPEGPYTFSDVALPERGPEYWDGKVTHNPRIVKHGNKYLLFYMGTTHPFDPALPPASMKETADLAAGGAIGIVTRANKRIGVASADSPYGPWKRMDAPIIDTKPNTYYSYLTSNPSPVVNADGSVELFFKSREYKETYPYHSGMSIGLAKAKSFEGPYEVVTDKPIFSTDQIGMIEDHYIWKVKDGSYRMIAKDQWGQISGHLGGGVYGVSEDGLSWEFGDQPVAYSKNMKWENGKTRKMGRVERVFALIEGDEPTHLFVAVSDKQVEEKGANSWNLVMKMKNQDK